MIRMFLVCLTLLTQSCVASPRFISPWDLNPDWDYESDDWGGPEIEDEEEV